MNISVGSPFPRLYPALTFLNTGVSRISANINSNRERLSPWKIPLFIHTSPNSWLPAINSVFSNCFRLFWITPVRFSAKPNISLWQSIIHKWSRYHYHMPFSSPPIPFQGLFCAFCNKQLIFFPCVFPLHPFFSSDNKLFLSRYS